jgi:hypothetical protein
MAPRFVLPCLSDSSDCGIRLKLGVSQIYKIPNGMTKMQCSTLALTRLPKYATNGKHGKSKMLNPI